MQHPLESFRVLLTVSLDPTHREAIEAEFPDIEWLEGSDPSSRAEHLPIANVVYGDISLSELAQVKSLHFAQFPTADAPLDVLEHLEARGVITATASGALVPWAAERALAIMLAATHGLWDDSPGLDILAGKTVTILGVGRLGRAVASLCQALGMQVLGCRRQQVMTPFVDEVFAPHEMVHAISKADWVVCTLPRTKETVGIVGHEILSAMRDDGALLVLSAIEVLDLPVFQISERMFVLAPHCLDADLDCTRFVRLVRPSPYPFDAANYAPVVNLFLRNLHHLQVGVPLENVVSPASFANHI